MSKYNIPYYLDNYERQYRFEEFGDTQNFFIRLIYYIQRERYHLFANPHGTYPPLDSNITAWNGKKILRNCSDMLSMGQFYLLQENAIDRAATSIPGVVQVEQIYGYAPQVTHIRAEEVDWVQPGIIDRSTAQNYTPVMSTTTNVPPYSVEYLEAQDIYRIYFSAPPAGLKVGDMVRIRGWRPWTSATVEGEIFTEEIPVLAITGNNVDVDAVPATARIFSIFGEESVIETQVPPSLAANLNNVNPMGDRFVNTFNKFLNGSTWYGYDYPSVADGKYIRLEKVASRKAPRNLSIGATVERTYFYATQGLPQQEPDWSPQLASGDLTDTVDTYTQPTAAEYLTMIANGDRVRARSDSIGQILGDVWFFDKYWIRAQ